MEKTDVFLWMEDEDYPVASTSLLSLKKHIKTEIGSWFLLGKKGEKLERLGYDLGVRVLPRPESLNELGELARTHGEAGHVIFWSSLAVLLADWEPWQKDQSRLWAHCPAALVLRSELPQWAAAVGDWDSAQSLGASHHTYLKETQVKTLPFEEYEKAAKGGGWLFSPTVLILEKTTTARKNP